MIMIDKKQQLKNTRIIKKGEDLTFTNFKGKEQSIGTVVDVIDQSDNGLHMTVVKEPDICITLQDKQFCLFYSVI